MTDYDYMHRAIALARKGEGWTSPNPMVGAVIVKDGRIIGEGYHRRHGGPHAERDAIASCTENPRGATLYVTLEPCCHHGRTPPCTDAILEAGIARVVIGSFDPNPKVAGKGALILREHDIAVEEGFMRAQCDALNPVFFHFITTGLPYLAMKYAMTADGKIAAISGASQWITGETAREQVHQLRHKYSAILVGIETVLADNPLLTCRMEGGKNPVRIICDSALRIPTDSQLCKTEQDMKTIVACAAATESRKKTLEERGITVLTLPGADGRVDFAALLKCLGGMQIDSILVEGGAAIHYSALCSGQVKKLYCYIAPKLFGGTAAKTPVGGMGVCTPQEAFLFSAPQITLLGEDVLLEFDKKEDPHVHRNH